MQEEAYSSDIEYGEVEFLEDEDGNSSPNCEFLAETNVECQICHKYLETSTVLKQHIETEHYKEACQKCNKKFFTAALLRKHLRCAHLESMNMKCPLCDLVLKNKYNLQQHIYTHSKNPCFECPHDSCNFRKFRHINSLRQHERIHENRNRRKCPVCGKLVTRLTEHVKKHNSERQFACDMCNRRFLTMRMFAEHKAAHAGVTYQCQDCEMRYLNKSTLYKHRKSVHLLVTHACPFCSRVYNRHDNMTQHVKQKHGEELADSERMKSSRAGNVIDNEGDQTL